MSATLHEPARVFLFEDNADDEAIALRALGRCKVNVSVEVARDGQLALDLLGLGPSSSEARRTLPDLIISDLKMPKLNGIEVLREAKAHEEVRDVPFVVLTSSDDQREVERCMELGAAAYCAKPVSYQEYMACVTQMVEKWLLPKADVPTPACELDSSEETGSPVAVA